MNRILLSFLTLAMFAGTAWGALDEATLAAGLKSHDRALHSTDGWIRDP